MVLDHDRRREAGRALGLSFVRVKALLVLDDGAKTMSELAGLLAVDSPYATVVTKDLAARALVERRGRPHHPPLVGEGEEPRTVTYRVPMSQGLTGLEFMATVPGDVGGGIAMNAGAFGQQVSDTLASIRILDRQGRVSELPAPALDMRYRHTALPQGAIVLAARFALHAGDAEAIRERMRAMRAQRSDTQPLAWPNCGSELKHPEGDHAARLVEAAGLKGFAVGGARISEVHANFIVNDGSAKAADVLALIEKARREVKARFGVTLEPEVRIVGGS